MSIDFTKVSLQRIAQVLGIPENDFLLVGSHSQISTVSDALFQQLELNILFQSIQDPSMRQICIDFVRKLAANSIVN